MPQAIEEGLRWEPPLLAHHAHRDARHRGRGRADPRRVAVIVINMGSANHDAARWDRPRAVRHLPQPQASTSRSRSGPHMCLGMHLARMETRVVLDALLDRLPGLRLDPDGDDPYITGLAFRAPTSLPVLFAPR